MKHRLLVCLLALVLCVASLTAVALAEVSPSLRVNTLTPRYNEEINILIQAPDASAVRVWNDGDERWDYYDRYWNLAAFSIYMMCWRSGEWVVKAEYTSDDYPDDFDWDEADDLTWEQLGQPVSVTVGECLGTLNRPSAHLDNDSVTRGDMVYFTIDQLQGKGEWYFAELNRLEGTDSVRVENWHMDFAAEAGASQGFPTINLEPGDYDLWLSCEALDYDQSQTRLSFTVEESAAELPDMALYLSEESVLSYRSVVVYGYAEEADWMEVEIRKEGEPDWENRLNLNGSFDRAFWSSSEEGTFIFTLKAWRGDDCREAGPVSLVVDAPDGDLEAPAVEGVPAVLTLGEALDCEFTEVSNAEDYHVWLEYRQENGGWEHLYELNPCRYGTVDTRIQIPEAFFQHPGIYQLHVNCFALGYNGGYTDVRFLVSDSMEQALTLTVNGSTEDIEEWLSNKGIRVDVDIPEEATALRVLNGDNWEYFDVRDFNGIDGWSYGRGDIILVAQATDAEPVWREEGFDWGGFDWSSLDWSMTSNGVRLNVIAPFGSLDSPTLTVPENVEYGDWLEVTIGEVENAEDYYLRLYHRNEYGDEDECLFECDYDEAGQVRISTFALQLGETYCVKVWANAEGYDSGESEEMSFLVTERTKPLPPAVLQLSREEMLTQDNLTIYAYAPGADNMNVEILWDADSNWHQDFDGGGDYNTWNWGCSEAGTYTFKLTAWMDDEPIEAEPVELTVTAPNGDLEDPVIRGLPALHAVGEKLDFAVEKVNNAEDYHLELSYRPEDGGWEYVDDAFDGEEGDGSILYSIPGDCFQQPGMYMLQAHVSARGYNGGHTDACFLVSDSMEQELTLTVNGGTADIDNWLSLKGIRVNVTAPESVTALRVLNGDNWEYFDAQDFNGIDGWSFGSGDIVMVAQATTDDPVWREEDFDWGEFDWNDLDWSMISNGVRLHVISPYGTLDDPVLTVPESVAQGDWLNVGIGEVESAEDYYLRLYHRNEYGDEDDWPFDCGYETAGEILLPTVELAVGETYCVKVWANAEGYDSGMSEEMCFTVTPGSGEEDFKVTAAELLTQESASCSVYAPGAEVIRITCNDELWDERDSEAMSRSFSFDQPGKYVLKAIVPDGEGWRLIGEPIVVSVTAPKGALEAFIEAPATVAANGEAEFTVTWKHNGVRFFHEVTLNSMEWDDMPLETISITEGEEETVGVYRVSGEDLETGVPYRIETWLRPDAIGYEPTRVTAEILAVDSQVVDGTITVSESELLRCESALVTVDVPSATALWVYHGDDAWDGFVGSHIEEQFGFYQTGVNRVYAKYTTDPIDDPENVDFESLDWVGVTPVVTVQVDSLGALEAPDYTLESEIVQRGQPFRITIDNLQDHDEWYIGYLRDEDDRDVTDHFFWDEYNHTIRVETIDTEPGLYYLEIHTDAIGYESGDIRRFVAVEEPGEGLVVSLPESPVLTQDRPRVTAYAPGAEKISMAISIPGDDSEPQLFEQEGESFTEDVVFGSMEGERQVLFTATYPDGKTETSEAVIQLAAPYGDLPSPEIHMSQVWTQGQPLSFEVVPESAIFIVTEVTEHDTEEYVYYDEDLNFDDWSYSIPASDFTPGQRYDIFVFSTEVGYNYNMTTYTVAMLPEDPDTLTLPAALTKIDEEAFAGSAAQKIVIPATVTSVADRAFADCASLLAVEIEDGASGISAEAFDDAGAFTVYGVSGSDAQAYAEENGLATFIHLD